MRILPLLFVLLPCFGCSVMGPGPENLGDPVGLEELGAIEELIRFKRGDEALARLQDLRWELSRQIPYERMRQDLRIQRGARAAVLRELEQWEEQWPEHPDLGYLRARQAEDPTSRFERFRSLLRRHPDHRWIRHGAIVTAQEMGKWNLSLTWLETLADSLRLDGVGPESAASRRLRLLQARQANHRKDHVQAFRLLAADAFVEQDSRSLQEYLRTAYLAGDGSRQERAEQEFLLQAAKGTAMESGPAIDLAFARLLAEWPWCGKAPLEEVLAIFDGYLERAGAPFGWAEQPVYDLLGVARLVQPEARSGAISRSFANHRRSLLAGSAWGRGHEVHLLRGTRHLPLTWPGHEDPVEILLAEDVRSSVGRTAQGGSVFRGFYMMMDSVERPSERLQQRLDRYSQEGLIDLPRGFPIREEDRLDSLDLGLRLRLRTLSETGLPVAQVELLHLALHEAGHFGEVLRWIDFGLPIAGLLPRMLKSRQQFGDPLHWLEYRAQLRAMATGPIAGWAFAEILERGQAPGDAYHAPYRLILRDLVALAEEEGWPSLARWTDRSDQELAALALRLCGKKGIEPSPVVGVENLIQALIEADVLQEAPGNGHASEQVDQG